MAAPRRRRSHPTESAITPLRKHRKLLRDGSGSEVWPEHIEHVFVQGLMEFKNSSCAFSRGRSRWRNQFLVDYLHDKGIDRNKKQVASHIQVLRGMWKGQPEFTLVSSLEDDSDSGAERHISLTDFPGPGAKPSPSVTLDTDAHIRVLTTMHSPSISEASTHTSNPSPIDSRPSRLLPIAVNHAPFLVSGTQLSQQPCGNAIAPPSASSALSNALGQTIRIPGGISADTGTTGISPHSSPVDLTAEQMSYPEYASSGVVALKSEDSCSLAWDVLPQNSFTSPASLRITSGAETLAHTSYQFSVWANGVAPLAFTFTSPLGGDDTVVKIHISLGLPSTWDNSRCLPDMSGFRSSIRSLRSPCPVSTTRGRYETRVYFDGRLDYKSVESKTFDANAEETQLDSDLLTNCRWLDDRVQTRITQSVWLPQDDLQVWFVYELNRSPGAHVGASFVQAKGCLVSGTTSPANDFVQTLNEKIVQETAPSWKISYFSSQAEEQFAYMSSPSLGGLGPPTVFDSCHYSRMAMNPPITPNHSLPMLF